MTEQTGNPELRCKLYRYVGRSVIIKIRYELYKGVPLTGIASNHRSSRSNSLRTEAVKVSPLYYKADDNLSR